MDAASMAAAGFRSAALALVCAACTSIAADARNVEGTRWRVTAINGQATGGGDNFRVQFRNGQFGGRLGCNHFEGPYAVRRGTVMILGGLSTTEMLCEGPEGAFENRGFIIVRQPLQLRWSTARRLTLVNAAGSIDLELER